MWRIPKVATFALVLLVALSIGAATGLATAQSDLDVVPDPNRRDTGEGPDASDLSDAEDILFRHDLLERPDILYYDGCADDRTQVPGSFRSPSVCDKGSDDQPPTPIGEDALAGLTEAVPSDGDLLRPTRGTRDSVEAGPTTSADRPVPPGGTSSWPPVVHLAVLATALAAALVIPVVLASRRGDKNEIRSEIYEIVVDEPGATASEVADELDIHLTTAIYHLDVLQDQERVEGLRQGRSTLYFENHRKYGRLEKRVLTALRKDTPGRLLQIVAENPGIHCAEIARRMDLSRTSVKYHTDRLTDEDLLDERRRDGVLQLRVPERAQRLLQRYKPVA